MKTSELDNLKKQFEAQILRNELSWWYYLKIVLPSLIGGAAIFAAGAAFMKVIA